MMTKKEFLKIYSDMPIDKRNKVALNINYNNINGLWFPKSIIKDSYVILNSQKHLDYREILNIDDFFRINTLIPPTKFKIDFPKGLEIWDNMVGDYEFIK